MWYSCQNHYERITPWPHAKLLNQMKVVRNKLQRTDEPPASQYHCVCISVKACVRVSYWLCEGKIKGKCSSRAKKDAELNTSNTFIINAGRKPHRFHVSSLSQQWDEFENERVESVVVFTLAAAWVVHKSLFCQSIRASPLLLFLMV